MKRGSMRGFEEVWVAQQARRERFTTSPSTDGVAHAAHRDAIPHMTAGQSGPSAPKYPLAALCRAAGLPEPEAEFRFHPKRKWRADFAFLTTTPRVIVEVDGGVWSNGRHTRGAGFVADMEKLNAATLLGFAVLRYTPDRLIDCIADLRVLFARPA